MVDKKGALLLLFDRPKEPIFKEKGENNVILDVPKSFVAERFQSAGVDLTSRFGDDNSEHVTIKAPSRLPDLTFANERALSREAPFSLWIPKHSRIAGKLIELFMGETRDCDLNCFSNSTRSHSQLNARLTTCYRLLLTLVTASIHNSSRTLFRLRCFIGPIPKA